MPKMEFKIPEMEFCMPKTEFVLNIKTRHSAYYMMPSMPCWHGLTMQEAVLGV